MEETEELLSEINDLRHSLSSARERLEHFQEIQQKRKADESRPALTEVSSYEYMQRMAHIPDLLHLAYHIKDERIFQTILGIEEQVLAGLKANIQELEQELSRYRIEKNPVIWH